MIIRSQHLRSFRVHQFHEIFQLVIFAVIRLSRQLHLFRERKMTVGNTQTLIQNMRLAVVEHLQILIRKTGLKCRKQMTTCCHIIIDLLKQGLRCCIQSRHHQQIIPIKTLCLRPQEITFHIQLI